jgi:hypothetical protein
LPFVTLEQALRSRLSRIEEPQTSRLIAELSGARKRGYLRKYELLLACRWKSPRSLPLVRRNSDERVRTVTGTAFGTRSEGEKISRLTHLSGVSIPTASAILTLTDPRRYGVIDIRVWQLLFALGCVDRKPGGVGFRPDHWVDFLRILRSAARRFGVGARDVERTLFRIHREYHEGLLYNR